MSAQEYRQTARDLSFGTLVTETPKVNQRSSLLQEADSLVNGDRNAQYGDPLRDFKRTAAFWGAYLGVDLEPHDVAAMMSLLKISRIRATPTKRDSWTDLAGYAACGWHCVAPVEELMPAASHSEPPS